MFFDALNSISDCPHAVLGCRNRDGPTVDHQPLGYCLFHSVGTGCQIDEPAIVRQCQRAAASDFLISERKSECKRIGPAAHGSAEAETLALTRNHCGEVFSMASDCQRATVGRFHTANRSRIFA